MKAWQDKVYRDYVTARERTNAINADRWNRRFEHSAWPRHYTPSKGDIVKVVKGRKVPKGIVGKVFWIGEDRRFGGYRLGIKDGISSEPIWVAADNVQVLHVPPEMDRRRIEAAFAADREAYRASRRRVA